MIKQLLFNFFTRQAFSDKAKFKDLGDRLLSMQMDFQYELLLCVPLLLLGIIAYKFIGTFFVENTLITNISKQLPNLTFDLSTLIILNKDFFRGQSVIKRLKGYKIITVKTNQPANSVRCVIRNCTIIVWPIEVIVAFFNPHRRLGDLIAGTKMIETEKSDPTSIISDIKSLKFDLPFIITALVSILIVIVNNIIISRL